MGIRLSEKHGVNPSLMICFWCGEPKGIALLGRTKNDAEAPRRMLFDYELCDSCREGMETGFTIMEANESTNFTGQDPIIIGPLGGKEVYPTGNWWVIRTESAIGVFKDEDVEKGRVFISPDMATKIGLK